MKRHKSGAEKRKDIKKRKEAIDKSAKITSFLKRASQNNEEDSFESLNTSVTGDSFDTFVQEHEDLTVAEEKKLNTSSDLDNDHYLVSKVVFDIALLQSNDPNIRKTFLNAERIIPQSLPIDIGNKKFPVHIFHKTLQNGEKASRDWIYYSESTKSIYCACCLFANELESNFTKGWSRDKGWRKLKDKVPAHENSNSHLKNYVNWKNAVAAEKNETQMESLLMRNIHDETEKWKKILTRILDVILFLAERGLAFFGDSFKLGDSSNGNFLGIIELLSKYDVILNEHLNKVKNAQKEGKRLQVHYLSNDIQNEFIQICGDMVEKKILSEIRNAKYYSIIADSTPDSSHSEQFSIVIRYVDLQSNSLIQERFICFDEFYGKTGKQIAINIQKLLEERGSIMKNCVAGSFDNASSMSGINIGVQAWLKEANPEFMFSPCGNHTLNLVGNDAALCCTESNDYFVKFQTLFNFFSSSTSRWAILKKHCNKSLTNVSKTRWYARFNAAKPIVSSLNLINLALKEVDSNLNQSAESKYTCKSLLKFTSRYETVVMNSIWLPILTAVQNTNLLLEARDATLDVETENIDALINSIKLMRWEKVMSDIKEYAEKFSIHASFEIKRKFIDEAAVELHYQQIFNKIISVLQKSLQTRFSRMIEICDNFKFLWTFNSIDEDILQNQCDKIKIKFSDDISTDLYDEMIFFKSVYATNFKSSKPKEVLKSIIEMNLESIFPNLVVVLRIFLTIPVSVAESERTFSAQKRIKNFLRSTMAQEWLNGLAMLHINIDIARNLNFSEIIDKFAISKARKSLI